MLNCLSLVLKCDPYTNNGFWMFDNLVKFEKVRHQLDNLNSLLSTSIDIIVFQNEIAFLLFIDIWNSQSQ